MSSCDECRERRRHQPAARVRLQEPGLPGGAVDAPKITDHLCDDVRRALRAGARPSSTPAASAYALAPGLVRGLDYYTRTAWEFVADRAGRAGRDRRRRPLRRAGRAAGRPARRPGSGSARASSGCSSSPRRGLPSRPVGCVRRARTSPPGRGCYALMDEARAGGRPRQTPCSAAAPLRRRARAGRQARRARRRHRGRGRVGARAWRPCAIWSRASSARSALDDLVGELS